MIQFYHCSSFTHEWVGYGLGRKWLSLFLMLLVNSVKENRRTPFPSFLPTFIYDLINSVKLGPAENYCSFQPSSHHSHHHQKIIISLWSQPASQPASQAMNEQMTYLIFLCIICFFIFPSTFSPPLHPSLSTNPINSKQETFPPEVGWRNLTTSPDNNARNFLQISAGGFDINITLHRTLTERKPVCRVYRYQAPPP